MTSKSEKSYIQSSLLVDTPLRADGRGLLDYRSISLETGIIAQANGSARVNVGGTEIVAACKLEVEDVQSVDGVDGGRVFCAVSCSLSAYPHLSPAAIDELQYDFSQLLNSTLGHSSLRPSNLSILPRKRSWLLNLDCIVISDAGNIYDVLFMAARAALWDTHVPVTRAIEIKAPQKTFGDIGESGLDTRRAIPQAVDFELKDYWAEGDILDGRERWPVCITLNLISSKHFLDADLREDAAIPLRLLLIFSCPGSDKPLLQGMRLMGSGEMAPTELKPLVEAGQKYATSLVKSLNEKSQTMSIKAVSMMSRPIPPN